MITHTHIHTQPPLEPTSSSSYHFANLPLCMSKILKKKKKELNTHPTSKSSPLSCSRSHSGQIPTTLQHPFKSSLFQVTATLHQISDGQITGWTLVEQAAAHDTLFTTSMKLLALGFCDQQSLDPPSFWVVSPQLPLLVPPHLPKILQETQVSVLSPL